MWKPSWKYKQRSWPCHPNWKSSLKLKIYLFLFRWVSTYIHIFINNFLLHLGCKHFTLPYSVETYKSFMVGTSGTRKWLFCIKTSLFHVAQSSFILNKKQSICMSLSNEGWIGMKHENCILWSSSMIAPGKIDRTRKIDQLSCTFGIISGTKNSRIQTILENLSK